LKHLILIIVFSIPNSVFAQDLTKWVDSKGGVHYGDIPPNEKIYNEEFVDIRPNVVDRNETYNEYYRRRADAYDDYLQRQGDFRIQMEEKRFEENQRSYEEAQRRQRRYDQLQRDREYDNYLRRSRLEKEQHRREIRRRQTSGQR